MTAEHGTVCGRVDCGICGRRPPPPAPAEGRWRRLLRLLAR
jgi:hypothetical protein